MYPDYSQREQHQQFSNVALRTKTHHLQVKVPGLQGAGERLDLPASSLLMVLIIPRDTQDGSL